MDNFFLTFLILFTKVINKLLIKLNLGSGNTLPGKIALQIYPKLLTHKSILPKKGLIFVSATNGKTTTTKIITHVLQKSGYKVTTNSSGSNLLRGIATTLLLHADPQGNSMSDYGVFEVDEFVLPHLLKFIQPTVLLLLNVSRDQLDRYGETDTILDRWRESLIDLPNKTKLILPKDDYNFENTFKDLKLDTYYFDAYMFPDNDSVLRGNYNAKNLGAALSALKTLNISSENAIELLRDFNLAWGRGEEINFKNNIWKIYLAKNPASFNANLDELMVNKSKGSLGVLLFILNDNIPDGRDVSWIYDIDTKKINNVCNGENLLISGTRSLDLAVRLNYAGVKIITENVYTSMDDAVSAISKKYPHEKIIVLSNYSGMLQIRKILTGRSIL